MTEKHNDDISLKHRREEIKRNIFTPRSSTREIVIDKEEIVMLKRGNRSIYLEGLNDSFRIYIMKGNIRESILI